MKHWDKLSKTFVILMQSPILIFTNSVSLQEKDCYTNSRTTVFLHSSAIFLSF